MTTNAAAAVSSPPVSLRRTGEKSDVDAAWKGSSYPASLLEGDGR
jgi:hypothetical protein